MRVPCLSSCLRSLPPAWVLLLAKQIKEPFLSLHFPPGGKHPTPSATRVISQPVVGEHPCLALIHTACCCGCIHFSRNGRSCCHTRHSARKLGANPMFLSKFFNLLVACYLGLLCVITVVSIECFLSGSHCSRNTKGIIGFSAFPTTLLSRHYYSHFIGEETKAQTSSNNLPKAPVVEPGLNPTGSPSPDPHFGLTPWSAWP